MYNPEAIVIGALRSTGFFLKALTLCITCSVLFEAIAPRRY